jgi:hypothetical protein
VPNLSFSLPIERRTLPARSHDIAKGQKLADHPIPEDLRAAFRLAVLTNFDLWYSGLGAEEIFLGGRSYSVEAICHRVSSYSDRMPDDVYQHLCGLLVHGDYRIERPMEQTYAEGARCILILCGKLRARDEARKRGEPNLP